ncbi:MAG TPA: PAS domain S-box protein [Candidatus Solibacter sp.]|nr:PAS domain S-box protein [Candidatus Solibacter sp.]
MMRSPLAGVDGQFSAGRVEFSPHDSTEVYRGKLAQLVLDELPGFAALLTTSGVLLERNRAAVDPALIGKSLWQTAWWRMRPSVQVELREAIERAARGEAVKHHLNFAPPEMPVTDFTLSPVRDAEDRVVFLLLRGTAEGQADERASALLGAIVDSSDDAIISKDLNGRIMTWNKSAERLFGYTAEEAIERSITILIPRDRLEEETRILERLRHGERIDHFETIRVRKDGTTLNVSLTISPVKDANGRIIGASKIARDITDRVQREHALEQANADLEQFAYSASHDLQEPLRMVAAYSELLKRKFGGKLGPEADEYIGYMVSGASRMESLLRDLRSYTQVLSGNAEPPGEIEPARVLRKVLANLEVAIADSGAIIQHADLPRVYIYEFQLQQVLQNLIGNAIRYRGAETPRIHISAERRNGRCLFAVQDNGIGIDPQYKEQIFGIFKRLHSAGEFPGTGMGLAICQRIIESGGGRIWVESKPGRGSTFYFTVAGAKSECQPNTGLDPVDRRQSPGRGAGARSA